ncbi:DUF1870 family protein, partial [Escherichia coli]|uniref:Aca2/YdiL-like domain-containing protein n=1 Tax=Escherichia coli TaxID=562 RepID=UPI0039C9ECC5
ADRNRSHWSTSKTPSYTKSVSWQHHPDRVVEQLLAMRQQRKKHLHAIIEKINNRIGNNTMRFFPDLTAFQRVYPDGNFIDWKIYQSVAAELYAHDLERLC